MNGVKVTNRADAVTIRISGRALDELRRTAEIVSRWSGCGYTPARIVRNVLMGFDQWRALGCVGEVAKPLQTLQGAMCDFFGLPFGSELEEKFTAAGFAVNR